MEREEYFNSLEQIIVGILLTSHQNLTSGPSLTVICNVESESILMNFPYSVPLKPFVSLALQMTLPCA